MVASDLGAPLGAQETMCILRDYASDSGKLTLLDVLASSEESDFVAFAQGGTTLEELCDKAHRNWEMFAPSFDAIGAEEFTNQKAPRPPRYCAPGLRGDVQRDARGNSARDHLARP